MGKGIRVCNVFVCLYDRKEAASGRSESIDDIFSKAKSKAASAAQPEGGSHTERGLPSMVPTCGKPSSARDAGSKRRTQTGDGKRQKEVKKPKRGSLEDPFGRQGARTTVDKKLLVGRPCPALDAVRQDRLDLQHHTLAAFAEHTTWTVLGVYLNSQV